MRYNFKCNYIDTNEVGRTHSYLCDFSMLGHTIRCGFFIMEVDINKYLLKEIKWLMDECGDYTIHVLPRKYYGESIQDVLEYADTIIHLHIEREIKLRLSNF